MRSFIILIFISFFCVGIIIPIGSHILSPEEQAVDPSSLDNLAQKDQKSWQDVTVFALIVLCANIPLWIREITKAKETAKRKIQTEKIEKNSDEVKSKVNALSEKFISMTTVCEIKHGAVNDILSEHATQLKNHDTKIFNMVKDK